jgi:hypothetical protein
MIYSAKIRQIIDTTKLLQLKNVNTNKKDRSYEDRDEPVKHTSLTGFNFNEIKILPSPAIASPCLMLNYIYIGSIQRKSDHVSQRSRSKIVLKL